MSDQVPSDKNFLDDAPASRRDFLKRMATVAFAAPVIGTFTMDAVANAGTRRRRHHRHRPGCGCPNQTYGNQTYPNQICPNQIYPNQIYGNQTV
jgi:hypothetical protein